ncbi:TIGR01212 family radical SAM protein [Desulfolithobacter dissulfuricans]|uniref:TIGR01212 family radical SAM protein n=1 Tax=Desulfolithobacter dissulfuricans TaxID=2795293 RepID=A0A915XJN2_9BACT|nr:TIGR01212 family radical SAM protein [Desulfolithobacter dissulfuricans]BCO10540.1 TIGR01212 family radical SAM protein [Desulfolithobacter dissulfuricans]
MAVSSAAPVPVSAITSGCELDGGVTRQTGAGGNTEPVSGSLDFPGPLINTFSRHYRYRYGQPVGKIPLHTGHPCPNRARGGCIFCLADSFTPNYLHAVDPIEIQIARGSRYLLRDRFRLYFGYFQQETCTALPLDRLLPMLEQVLGVEDCVGLILSTRPDAVADGLVRALADLARQSGREILVELGLQSVHERSLQLLNRNHGVECYFEAAHRIRSVGLGLGVHLIMGIPGESRADMMATVDTVCAHGLDAIKLHHLQVIRHTPLHAMHRAAPIPLFDAPAYIELLTEILPRIPPGVVIHRLWSRSHLHLLIGPRWDVPPPRLTRMLHRALAEKGVYQGSRISS